MTEMNSSQQDNIDSLPIMNRKDALDRLDNNTVLLDKIISMFMEKTPNELVKIEKLLEENNIDQIGFVAHTIKGTSAMIGADRFSACALKIERLAKQNSPKAEIEEKFQMLKQIMNLLTDSLKT
ncbi:MAG TPA: Hpt domain-containing protein [Leptospiraceae bacterium]|nr:Hpt domain-containing protein [Leptospiraceae bacterium]HNF13158.1 Hpt domain-containing protein [Leptospiraceae bacterium]HNH07793.1 Hpt domain-containing protein [Leptospiraceae bacterium]HNI27214.1 Hpt domain-containing protein [Leptospiraceae bacterium]HNI98469.1 Hpt domain-containing protein [Leptospiraceae bacterium]